MTIVLSRHNRYLISIGGLTIAAALIVGLAYGATESERADIDRDAQDSVLMRDLAAELSDSVRDQESVIHSYLLARDATVVTDYEEAIAKESAAAVRFHEAAFEAPAVDAAVDDLLRFAATWRTTFADPALIALESGSSAIDAFVRGAVDDHEEFDDEIAPLGQQLDLVDTSLRVRGDALATMRTVVTAFGIAVMLLAAALAVWLIRRYGQALERSAMHAGVLNRFTEVTSFASDETAIAASNLEALALLTHPDASVTHILNRSKDRAVPEAISGPAIAEVLTLGALNECVGVTRGSMYVIEDAAAPLSVRCPVYPISHGTLACVPLSASETIGAVHLYWDRANALPLELRASVMRIAEHAALGIGNRRLLAALHGQANTDPRTGLANSRAFDRALEDALAARTGDEPISVLMLDLDHFKDFNDRYGHPAGDEALRSFAAVLRSCMRDGDMAARYGGEEFAVLLPGIDGQSAAVIAERIRARTEATIVALGAGQAGRITVSLGVASAPDHGADRISLLRVADEALYEAKNGGRNQVQHPTAGTMAADLGQSA